MAKRVQTRKKNLINIDELNAYKVAYEEKLKPRDYLVYVGVPALIFAVFSFILLYYWWFSLIMFLLGALYGITYYLPKSIKKQYKDHAFNQRNKFINNMTQLLTDENKTVVRALATAYDRAEGEFQLEINILLARLTGADNSQISESYSEFAAKYRDDVIFIQYLEQLETATLEGRTNIDTLKDIKSYHNEMKEKQNKYEKQKRTHLNGMKMLGFVIVIFILAINFSFEFNTYIDGFAHHYIGWITIGLYLLFMSNFFIKFSKYLFDDSIMEVEK
jgi:hypothetical protein